MARAQSPSWRSRLALTLDARGETGPGSVAGIHLGVVGAGIEWRAVSTLRLRASALLLGATGRSADERTAGGGAGGELAARAVPFPQWPVRPYVRASAGVLLFLRQPFLPGGDFYDFIIQLGVGLELPVSDRLSFVADLHAVHLSNGQGLGPINPAFTGEGVLAGAVYALEPPDAATNSPAHTCVDEARVGWVPGATGDTAVGTADGALQLGVRARVAERLTRRTLAVLDFASGVIDGEHFGELGIDVAGHWNAASAGVHVGTRRGAGRGSFIEQGQIEAHVSPEASLIAMAALEQSRDVADTYRAALVLRLFPIDTFLIELGAGYGRTASVATDRAFKPTFAIEWQLPLDVHAWQVSLFLERQIEPFQVAGVRVSWNMGSSIRDSARRTGWRRLR